MTSCVTHVTSCVTHVVTCSHVVTM